MKNSRSLLAATETILIWPALLFMVSLFMRQVQPRQYEPAHTAQRIVDWHAARPNLGLSLFLEFAGFSSRRIPWGISSVQHRTRCSLVTDKQQIRA
jgi:hypothetical protein